MPPADESGEKAVSKPSAGHAQPKDSTNHSAEHKTPSVTNAVGTDYFNVASTLERANLGALPAGFNVTLVTDQQKPWQQFLVVSPSNSVDGSRGDFAVRNVTSDEFKRIYQEAQRNTYTDTASTSNPYATDRYSNTRNGDNKTIPALVVEPYRDTNTRLMPDRPYNPYSITAPELIAPIIPAVATPPATDYSRSTESTTGYDDTTYGANSTDINAGNISTDINKGGINDFGRPAYQPEIRDPYTLPIGTNITERDMRYAYQNVAGRGSDNVRNGTDAYVPPPSILAKQPPIALTERNNDSVAPNTERISAQNKPSHTDAYVPQNITTINQKDTIPRPTPNRPTGNTGTEGSDSYSRQNVSILAKQGPPPSTPERSGPTSTPQGPTSTLERTSLGAPGSGSSSLSMRNPELPPTYPPRSGVTPITTGDRDTQKGAASLARSLAPPEAPKPPFSSGTTTPGSRGSDTASINNTMSKGGTTPATLRTLMENTPQRDFTTFTPGSTGTAGRSNGSTGSMDFTAKLNTSTTPFSARNAANEVVSINTAKNNSIGLPATTRGAEVEPRRTPPISDGKPPAETRIASDTQKSKNVTEFINKLDNAAGGTRAAEKQTRTESQNAVRNEARDLLQSRDARPLQFTTQPAGGEKIALNRVDQNGLRAILRDPQLTEALRKIDRQPTAGLRDQISITNGKATFGNATELTARGVKLSELTLKPLSRIDNIVSISKIIPSGKDVTNQLSTSIKDVQLQPRRDFAGKPETLVAKAEGKQITTDGKPGVAESKMNSTAKINTSENKPVVVDGKPAAADNKNGVLDGKPKVVDSKTNLVDTKQTTIDGKPTPAKTTTDGKSVADGRGPSTDGRTAKADVQQGTVQPTRGDDRVGSQVSDPRILDSRITSQLAQDGQQADGDDEGIAKIPESPDGPDGDERYLTGAEIAMGLVMLAGAISNGKRKAADEAGAGEGGDSDATIEDLVAYRLNEDYQAVINAASSARTTWLINVGETLTGLGERFYDDARVGYLIADINAGALTETLIDDKRIVELTSRQMIYLPNKEDLKAFYLLNLDFANPELLVTIVAEREFDRQLVQWMMSRAMGVRASMPTHAYEPGATAFPEFQLGEQTGGAPVYKPAYATAFSSFGITGGATYAQTVKAFYELRDSQRGSEAPIGVITAEDTKPSLATFVASLRARAASALRKEEFDENSLKDSIWIKTAETIYKQSRPDNNRQLALRFRFQAQ